ncbi:MAG: hypothetical protein ACREVC_06790 [Burkholderiales bacterium]
MTGDLKISIEKLEARTKAGRLRGLMPMIEGKIKQGIRHVEIIQALNEQGFAISEHTYRSYLQRYRKKQRAGSRSAQGGAQAQSKPSQAPLAHGAAGRPRTFDYDPRGNPDLLK